MGRIATAFSSPAALVLLLPVAIAAFPVASAHAQSTSIVQVSGDAGTNIIGSNNVVLRQQITVTNNITNQSKVYVRPRSLRLFIRRAFEERDAETAAQQAADNARMAQLEQAARLHDEDIGRLNSEILNMDRQILELTTQMLDIAVDLQDQVAAMPEGDERAEATLALSQARLDRVREIVEHEETKTDDYTNFGALFSTASDQWGGFGGFIAGLTLSGLHEEGTATDSIGLIPLAGIGEIMFGSVSLRDQSSFMFSFGVLAGPELRLGAPNGLRLGIYYYCPAIIVQEGHARFPLVGLGASVGVHFGLSHVSVTYRYSFNSILYDDPDTHFLGLIISFYAGPIRSDT